MADVELYQRALLFVIVFLTAFLFATGLESEKLPRIPRF